MTMLDLVTLAYYFTFAPDLESTRRVSRRQRTQSLPFTRGRVVWSTVPSWTTTRSWPGLRSCSNKLALTSSIRARWPRIWQAASTVCPMSRKACTSTRWTSSTPSPKTWTRRWAAKRHEKGRPNGYNFPLPVIWLPTLIQPLHYLSLLCRQRAIHNRYSSTWWRCNRILLCRIEGVTIDRRDYEATVAFRPWMRLTKHVA